MPPRSRWRRLLARWPAHGARGIGSRDGSCLAAGARLFASLLSPPAAPPAPPPPRACAAPWVLSPSASGRPRGRARARAAPVEGQPAGPPGAGCGRGGLGSALARVPQRLGAGPAASPTGLGAGFAAPDGATAREGEAPGSAEAPAFWVRGRLVRQPAAAAGAVASRVVCAAARSTWPAVARASTRRGEARRRLQPCRGCWRARGHTSHFRQQRPRL